MTKQCILAFALGLVTSSCAGFDDARDGLVEQGAEFYDETLVTSEFIICRGASVGSVMRRYWQDVETAQAWMKLCAEAPAVNLPEIIVPETSN